MIDPATLLPADLPGTTPAGERLLQAAERLFYARGIGAVGVDLIAETAGVTKRTLYQRFGSKEALVVAYLQRRAYRWQVLVAETLGELVDPTEQDQLRAVFTAAQQWASTNPRGCAFINAWAELGSASHPAAAVIRAEKRWMSDLFAGLTDSPELAAAVHLVYEGAHVVASTLAQPDAYVRAEQTAQHLLGCAIKP